MFRLEGNTIRIIRGDTGILSLSIDNYKIAPGDLVTFTVKRYIEDIDHVIKKIIDQFEDGKAKIILSEADTLNLEPGKYVYDIQVNLQDGRIDTVITPSQFIIERGVTE